MTISICPTGEHGKLTSKFCSACGRPALEVELPEPPAKAIVVTYAWLQNSTCPDCGAVINFTVLTRLYFCPGCGASIAWKRVEAKC